MPTYKTPGVFIEEISKFPPSIAAVDTAIPAFIGYTLKTKDADGNSLVNRPIRITSLLEFEEAFGTTQIQEVNVNVVQEKGATRVAFNGTPPEMPKTALYYSMQLFYSNGGGPCYIVSVGDDPAAGTKKSFTDAINALEGEDQPTLIVFPDACLLGNDQDYADVVNHSLSHCKKMQDRFTIADVRDSVPTKTDDNADVTNNFRSKIASDLADVKYGAAYFPYLRTSLPFNVAEDKVVVKTHTVDGAGGTIPADTAISDAKVKVQQTAIYNAVKQFLAARVRVTLPPSGAVAGVFARVDRDRGVWKAPANVSIREVIGPAITITNDFNDGLNIDPTSGKSVNAIRSFVGKGTMVWGARTLAGNDTENCFVPVRRFLIFAEESIKKACEAFVFEPNDANTWVKVKSMIESFLTRQWRDGALAGAKPEDAFEVLIGLNKTMTAQDILDGYMIVEVKLAIVRPAEFIVLRFSQKMQQS